MADYTARSSVILNGQEAEDQLEKLGKRAKDLREEMNKLRKANDLSGFKEKEKELREVNKEMGQMRKEAFSVENVLKNLSGASFKEIATASRKATAEWRAMKQTDPGYREKAAQVKLLNAKMRELSSTTRSQRSLLSRVGDGFNKYFGMATTALASFAGVAFTVKSATEAYAKHDDVLSDVMKTTGLTKDEVKALNKELTNIDTRSSRESLNAIAEEGGRIGIAKDEIFDFVRVMDIANVALGDSFQGGTEEIANMLGKLKFLYKETKGMELEKSYLSIASAINELGAEGVASEQNIAEFTTRIGALPNALKPSIADTFALGAGFEESGIKAEIASRAYSIVLNRAATETDKFAAVMKMSTAEVEAMINTNPVDFFFAFAESLKGMNATETARTLDELKINADGANKVIGAAANSTDRFRELLLLSNKAFGEANSVITEFGVKNENAQAKLEKARKVYSDMQLELGERLAPAYASVIHKGSAMLKVLGATVEFLFENRKALIMAAVAIGSYTVAVNAANWATKIYNALTTAATAITKGFNTAVKANPVGLIISLLTTAATAFFLFGQKADSAKKAQKEFNDEVARGNELLGQSKTLEERASIVKNLSKEQLETLKSDLAMQIREEENFHATLLQKLKKRLEEDSTLKELNERRSQEGLTQMQKININAQIAARQRQLSRELDAENKTNQQRLKNLKAHQAKVAAELKNRPKEPGEESTPSPQGTPKAAKETAYSSNDSAAAAAQNAIKQQLLELQITEDEAKDALLTSEIEFLEKKKALQIQYGDDYLATESSLIDKKLQQAKEADKMAEADKKAAHAKAIQELTTKETEEVNTIKKQLSDRLITEEQAQQAILEKEIEFLNQRIALKTQWGEDTAELEGKILDKTNKIAENALKADEDRARQLADLRREFEDEEILKAQEKAAALAELDTFHKAGMLESEEEYQRLKTNIVEKYEGDRFEKTSHYLKAANDLLGGAASFFADIKDAELAKAGDNAEERARIEEEYAEKQKKVAIGQAIIAGAMAVMELWAAKSVLPEPANSIYKGVMTGVIVGTTIAQIAKIKSAKFAEGKYPDLQTRENLHTGMYGDKPQMAIFNEVPGEPEIVVDGKTTKKLQREHPEIVKAIYDVRDGKKPDTIASEIPEHSSGKYPDAKPIIDIMEIARRNGSLARLDLRQIVQAIPAKQYAQGGFATQPYPATASAPSQTSPGTGNTDPELRNLIRENLKTMKELQKLKVSLSLETFEKERGKYIDIKQTSGL